MRFTLVVVAIIAVLALEAEAAPSKSQRKYRTGYRYLGSVKFGKSSSSGIGTFGILSSGDDEKDYWESVNAAGYAEAKRDCERNGDTLLYLETQEEVDNVTTWLQDTDNSGSLYWVGGKFDTRSNSYKWENGFPVSPNAPWGAGQPKERKSTTRVVASTIGREIELRTQANTKNTRYICEGSTSSGTVEQIPVPCYKNNDIVIVVDSSGSISYSEYIIAKEFTARLASAWADNVGSKVSVIIYSNFPETIFGLKSDQSVQNIKDKIYNMRHVQGGTDTNRGIDAAVEEIQKNGGNSIRNIVLLTDGQSWDRQATKASADKANSLGIRTYSVGIGSGINQNELLDIAGGKADHVFSHKQFDQLLTLLRPISLKVCE